MAKKEMTHEEKTKNRKATEKDDDNIDGVFYSIEEFNAYMDGLIEKAKNGKKKVPEEEPTLDLHKLRNMWGYKVREERKWAKQRAMQGFCEADLWEINRWFCLIIPEMLRALMERNSGIPQELIDQEYLENREKYPLIHDVSELQFSSKDEAKEAMHGEIAQKAFDHWNEILTDMANRFEHVRELWDSRYHCPEGNIQEETEEAFSLFAKWFHHLWW